MVRCEMDSVLRRPRFRVCAVNISLVDRLSRDTVFFTGLMLLVEAGIRLFLCNLDLNFSC